MRVNVLLFAQYRDAAGAAELHLDLPLGATALEAVAVIRKRAAHIPERPAVAINQEYSSLEQTLAEGDELALLPPVAGG